MKILGVSAFYHDSAAALIEDGRIVGAAQEERFTRKKHDNSFPKNSINYLLQEAKCQINDINVIVFYENPYLKFNRIIKSFAAYAPTGFDNFFPVIAAQWKKIKIKSIIARELDYRGQIEFIKHHASHAASAFYPSPFNSAAFLTVDGVGECETTTYGVGQGNNIKLQKRISFPHSLGLLYAALTYFTGFKVNSGEYKVMGLAPYGQPKYVKNILGELVDVKDDGSFRLNMSYFDYGVGVKMTNEKFEKLFGRAVRPRESTITQDDMDLARSIQEVTDMVMVKMARHIRQATGERYLCLAGGVALNCVANSKILTERIFDDIWIQPAAGDAGGALGAALYYWHQMLDHERQPIVRHNTYLGPQFSQDEINDYLDYNNIPYTYHKNIEAKTADLLVQGKIIGWFSGRMEFGPRALGGRSILGDARLQSMQADMNLKIKFRESFRPFAPSVLEDKAADWFEIDQPSPYMLLVADVKKDKRKIVSNDNGQTGFDMLKAVRSDIPAVTHVDFSARLQTVSREMNRKFYDLIANFYGKTGCPVIINTSFNVRGEPIVCAPEDAYRCFMRTGLDYLVLENFLIDKKAQPNWQEKDDWREDFVLD